MTSLINWVYVAAIVAVMAAVQWLDADDIALEQAVADEQKAAIKQAQQARWEYQKHILHCHRTAGPGSKPAYTPDGDPLCISRTGHTTPLDAPIRPRPAGV